MAEGLSVKPVPTITWSDVSTREAALIQATVRDAVSSADIDLLAGAAVRWANGQTGARGSITGLTESARGGRLCRGFVTTRESYDGVRLFSGEACMVSAGLWRMESFEAL